MARQRLVRRKMAINDTQDLGDIFNERTVTDMDRANGGFRPPFEFTGHARLPRVHTSVLATLGLIVSVLALCTTLTGVLAIEGLALGLLGAFLSFAGIVAAGQPGTTGHGTAAIGVLCGLAAISLSVLAMTGELSWLNSKVNEVDRWHGWLLAQWPWLSFW